MAVLPITGVTGAAPTAPATSPASGTGQKGSGFGHLLADALDKLNADQVQAGKSSEAIATGKSNDISKVAMDIEQATLSLQLAVQVRNKIVDAYQELFRMQV
jgi:flagellar hook-basal body complex protein FliE